MIVYVQANLEVQIMAVNQGTRIKFETEFEFLSQIAKFGNHKLTI
jgi:carbon monoxide dehydrogenase subunit G